MTRVQLAEQCERLREGSRTVDRLIGVAIGAFSRRRNKTYGNRIDYVDVRKAGKEGWPGHGGDHLVPCYTHSLDDAMDLAVPAWFVVAIHEEREEGNGRPIVRWEVRLGHRTDEKKRVIVADGPWLPAVLCAAWLLAGAA